MGGEITERRALGGDGRVHYLGFPDGLTGV